jgi:hypothetical protein
MKGSIVMAVTAQPDSKSTSRRAVLAGALGGIGALAAAAIGRASPVRGADGETVVVGGEFDAASVTGFNATNTTALYGASTSGIGVRGDSSSSIGLYATSVSNLAIWGHSAAASYAACAARSAGNGTGVEGYSGGGPLPPPRPKTGVYGNANQDIFSTGVYGLSDLGVGLRGKTTSGYAGYFEGRVYTNAFYELGEVANPAAPLANRARLFVRDNGSGKTQLCVRFHTGSVRVISTEP